MSKGKLVVAAVAVFGVGYFAAQAFSSMMFERELTHALQDLERRNDLSVSRTVVNRGWLVSRGEIRLAPREGEAWRIDIPYTARHGLLTTLADGELSFHPDAGAFGEAPQPRWSAEYRTLAQTFDASLSMTPFAQEMDAYRLEFGGADLRLQGQRSDMTLTGQIAPWSWEGENERLEVGPLVLESQYRFGSAPGHFLQRDDLHLSTLVYLQTLGPDIELELDAVGYRGEVQLDTEELSLAARLSLGEARLGGQPALAGQVELSLTRVNADATRALGRHLQHEELLDAPATLSEAQRETLLARLEPYLIAMLVDSPRLVVESLSLESPLLGLHIALAGEISFEGEGLGDLSLRALDDPAARADWVSRLNGHFLWQDVPLLVALQLGLPLDTQELRIDIVEGEVRVNDQAVPPLFNG